MIRPAPRALSVLVAIALAWVACARPLFSSDTCGRFDAGDLSSASVQTFRERTASAVASLKEIADSLGRNDTTLAASAVARARDSWCELEHSAEYFRMMAEWQSQRCHTQATTFIDRVNELYQQQKALNDALEVLDADLREALADQQLSSAEIQRLQGKIAANQRELEMRQARLKELRDWWWVPGYGQYLAIRELVDKDSVRSQGLTRDLQALAAEVGTGTADIERLRSLQQELRVQMDDAVWSANAFGALRDTVHGELGEIKQAVVFFTETRGFWTSVQKIDLGNIGSTLRFIEELQQELNDEVSATLLGEEKDTLRVELEELAAKIDGGDHIFLDDDTGLCEERRAVACPAGHTLESGLCWAPCPAGFAQRDKVCLKPENYTLAPVPANAQIRANLELYKRLVELSYSTPEQNKPEFRAALTSAGQAMLGVGIAVCEASYGAGMCVANPDGWGWQINCRANFAKFYAPAIRIYPPPPPSPPVCWAQCPPEMADLGVSCGRTFALP